MGESITYPLIPQSVLDAKADDSDVATLAAAVALKADGSAVTAALAGKADASALAAKAPIADPVFTGVATAPTLKSSGNGAGGFTAPSRFLGTRTTAGPPTGGTFLAGDWGYDSTGVAWVCTVGGTPGTWIDGSSSGKEIAFADLTGVTPSPTTTSAVMVDVPGLAIAIPAGISRPIMLHASFPAVWNNTAANGVSIAITTNAGAEKVRSRYYSPAASLAGGIELWKRLPAGTTGTFKIMWEREIGGTATMLVAADGAAGACIPFLRAVTV